MPGQTPKERSAIWRILNPDIIGQKEYSGVGLDHGNNNGDSELPDMENLLAGAGKNKMTDAKMGMDKKPKASHLSDGGSDATSPSDDRHPDSISTSKAAPVAQVPDDEPPPATITHPLVDHHPSSTATTQLGEPTTNPNRIWKAKRILGRMINGSEVLYNVDWDSTWESRRDLGVIRDALNDFDWKLQDTHSQIDYTHKKQPSKGLNASIGFWQCRIMGRRIIGGSIQYCLAWKPTWEPVMHLTEAKELIDEFEAKRKWKKRRRSTVDDLADWSVTSKRQR